MTQNSDLTNIRTVVAFDPEAVHKGNKALEFNHADIKEKVAQLLSKMSLAQKINEIRGLQPKPIDGLYYSGGDTSLGIPLFKMVDGPRGARTGYATAFPVAIARAATFDSLLEHRVGSAIGLEVKAKGGNVLLAPTINLLRHPGWGRAQETYSEDVHHMSVMGMAFISGAQNHVMASPKHFAANNVENTRFDMSANLSPRVLHEIYLPHFKRCIQEAKASSIMSAYNKVNQTYCGENPELLTTILRDDWGFEGFVESDWFLGARSTAESLNAGLDIEMPSGFRFSDDKLVEAIENGELTEETISRAASRSLYMKIAWQLDKWADDEPSDTVVESTLHYDLAREVAEKSIVLLKNNDALLPLNNTKALKIAVVGDLGNQVNLGDRGSSFVTSTHVSLILPELENLGLGQVTHFGDSDDFSTLDQFDITIIVAGLTYQEEGEFIPTQQQEAEGGQLARGGDRALLKLPENQETLIKTASKNASKSVVVLQGGSAIEVSSWIDGVDGLLMAWYGGCEGGKAVSRVLFGEVNPSGKLPVSFPKQMSDLNDWSITSLQVDHPYLHGYRHLDNLKIEPAFEFGFGLSYSEFGVSEFNSERMDAGFNFSTIVTNTGQCDGATVIQLYVAYPGSAIERAPVELKAFGRVDLKVGESARLELSISDDDLKFFHEAERWTMEACGYQFSLGFSSRDRGLETQWQYKAGLWQSQI